ncbi:STAS domain-containing protein [Streptomyces sp. NPDC000345]|uniref:STAS domain-containing protein n=1 Tax=Streptomyces sp. NPDC000345 TaxID=3364537 RepID=UPI0036C5B176
MTTHSDAGSQPATTLDAAGDARIRITGELDRDTDDELGRAATECPNADPAPRHLHLDCARLTLCDSLGLATLLMIHRDAATAGTRLHLDERPDVLQRLLRTTGTAHVFSDAAAAAHARTPGEPDRSTTTRVAPLSGRP